MAGGHRESLLRFLEVLPEEKAKSLLDYAGYLASGGQPVPVAPVPPARSGSPFTGVYWGALAITLLLMAVGFCVGLVVLLNPRPGRAYAPWQFGGPALWIAGGLALVANTLWRQGEYRILEKEPHGTERERHLRALRTWLWRPLVACVVLCLLSMIMATPFLF